MFLLQRKTEVYLLWLEHLFRCCSCRWYKHMHMLIHTSVYGVLQGSPNDRALLSGALWQRKVRGRQRVRKILSHSFPTSGPSTKRLSCFTEDHHRQGDTKMVMRDTNANMVNRSSMFRVAWFIYRRSDLNEWTVFAILGAVQCSL